MNSTKSTFTKVLTWLLMGVSVILTALFFSGEKNTDTVQPFIIWAYILFAAAAVMALLFPIYFFIRNPKNATKSLAGLGLMAVLFIVGFLFADATPIPSPTQNPNLSDPTILVISDTGLIVTYLMFALAIVLLIYTGIRGVFQK